MKQQITEEMEIQNEWYKEAKNRLWKHFRNL